MNASRISLYRATVFIGCAVAVSLLSSPDVTAADTKASPVPRNVAPPVRERPDFWSVKFNSPDEFNNSGISTYHHGSFTSKKLHFNGAAETEVGYAVYLPPGYEISEARYPILYFLHGNNGTENQNNTLIRKADELITKGELPPFIIACPAGGNAFYGNQFAGQCQVQDMILEEFLPHIEKTYRVKPGARFRHIQGMSAGGFGAIMYAIKRPDLFGTATSIAGAFDGARFNVWAEMYDRRPENFRPFDVAVLAVENKSRIGGLRIAQWVGSDDITRRTNEQMHRFFTENGIAHTYNDWNSRPLLQGVTHKLSQYYEPYGKEILQFHAEAFRDSPL